MKARLRLASSTLAFALCALGASAQQQIPIRTVTTPVATDSGIFRAINAIRALSDGRIIVNDMARRRLLMFDSTLRSFTTLADTAAAAPNRYPPRIQASIFAFTGDSTIFVDVDGQALVVVEPSGRFGRVMAPPKSADIYYLGSSTFGTPGFDTKGRLIYRGIRRDDAGMRLDIEMMERGDTTPRVLAARSDSAPVVRADFETRVVDTLAWIQLPTNKRLAIGNTTYSAFNPLPLTDEWTLLPDGTVAVVRGQDYHLDLWHVDGTKSSSPKIPYDWKRITIEERQALLDSVKKADEVRRASLPPLPASGRGGPPPTRRPIFTVDAEEMWEFYPPVRPGQMKADPSGNIWILPSTSSAAGRGLVFDVVRRDGTILERVRLPEGRNLIGFGPGQTVYMIYAPNPQRILLERASVVR
jgi:hypothetical protein